MKSIFILFVYGVACCLAMPKCTTDETMKCASLIPFKFEENDEFPIVDINEEFMDKYCDFLHCMNDLLDRCGLPVPEMLMGPVSAMGKFPKFPFDNKKQIKETYDKFCPETSPLRKKFIANGNCIFKASIEVATSDCMGIIPNSENMTDSCGPYLKFRKCVQDVIERRCGEEAREVIDEMGPSIEDTGCSE